MTQRDKGQGIRDNDRRQRTREKRKRAREKGRGSGSGVVQRPVSGQAKWWFIKAIGRSRTRGLILTGHVN